MRLYGEDRIYFGSTQYLSLSAFGKIYEAVLNIRIGEKIRIWVGESVYLFMKMVHYGNKGMCFWFTDIFLGGILSLTLLVALPLRAQRNMISDDSKPINSSKAL